MEAEEPKRSTTFLRGGLSSTERWGPPKAPAIEEQATVQAKGSRRMRPGRKVPTARSVTAVGSVGTKARPAAATDPAQGAAADGMAAPPREGAFSPQTRPAPVRGTGPPRRGLSPRGAQARGQPPPPRRLRSAAGARRARSLPRAPAPAEGGAAAAPRSPPDPTQRRAQLWQLRLCPPATAHGPPGTTWRQRCGRAWRRPRGARPGRTAVPPLLAPLPAGVADPSVPAACGKSGAGPCTAPPCCPMAAALSAAHRAAAVVARRSSCPRSCS